MAPRTKSTPAPTVDEVVDKGRPRAGKTADEIIEILEVQKGRAEFCILGSSAYINNRKSDKTRQSLLLPRPRKNAAERATTLKHDVYEEYRASAYRFTDPSAPTLLCAKAVAFKKSMMSAALDLPGTKRAQIGRLVWVLGDFTAIYGIPQILLSDVNSADMNHTPDIRTRAIIREWACRITVTFVQPLIRAQAVARLLYSAGLFIGVGDGRNEKGALSFGAFEIVEPDNADFVRIVKSGGRAGQLQAMDKPTAYDDDTADLLSWYDAEIQRRQLKGVS